MNKAGVLLMLSMVLITCTGGRLPVQGDHAIPSLSQTFSGDFLIGTAVSAGQLSGKDTVTTRIIQKHFNVLTPENVMKCEIIHPAWNQYNFEMADKLIEFAQANRQQVVGHTLIWHSQLSPFVRNMKHRDSVRMFFEHHISTVAARYKGKLLGWDVVNEALNEDGTMRKTVFLEQLGEDYVTEAFRLAQKADPEAELYYNDYNNEQPQKRAGTIRIIQKIQKAGIRIDAVGIQGHWHAGKVPFQDIEASIEAYAALGLKVMITELDIEVLPRNFQGADVNQRVASNPALNPYRLGVPDSVLKQQADDYARLFQLFLKHKNTISRITFWGVNDGSSWLNNWPVQGRTNYPLLFDRDNKPKPAFYAITALKQ